MKQKTRFSAWVPEKARQAWVSLLDQNMILKAEEGFISVLFKDENLKPFWNDFDSASRQFFTEFIYHIVRSHRFYESARNKPQRVKIVKEDLKTLRRTFQKIGKTVKEIYAQDILEKNALDDLLSNIEYCQAKALPILEHQLGLALKKPYKNLYRPVTRESFSTGEAAYYGRIIDLFFKKIKKQAVLKSHICDVVNSLLDLKDDPLTEEKISEYLRNSRKKGN